MRTIAAPALAVLNGPVVPMVLLLDLAFDTRVRLCTGSVTVQIGADLYYGTGTLGAVEAVTDEVQSTSGLRFTLSGVPLDSIALALSESVRGTACTMRAAILDPDTHAVLDAPVVFTGTLDSMPITHGVESATIGVVAIHRGDTYRRPKPLRYTDGDQQRLYSGDTSMRYVLAQAQAQDVWPAAGYFRQ
jgi:hypothetical protein